MGEGITSADRCSRLSFGLLLLLAAVGALGSIAIHMFVPALPAVARDLHASEAAMQSALTLYLLALGCGQLICGPASDIAGRRPILLVGTVLFTLGSAGAAVAQGATLLIAARILQALGGAAGIVAARTIVSDLVEPRQAAGRLAMLTTVVLISPAASPVIGGVLTALWGWRSIFILLTMLGFVGAALAVAAISETKIRTDRQLADLLPAYARLLRNGRFRRYCVVSAAASCSLYMFLAGSSFILNRRFGLPPAQAGLCYFLIASAAMVGTLLVGRLERTGIALRTGTAAILAGGTLMVVMALLGDRSLAALLAPMTIVGMGAGIVVPASVAGAMHAEPGVAGTASSLAGALQMSATGLLTTLAAQLHSASLLSLGIGISSAGLIALVVAPRGASVRERE
jgi:MFS transporter, DHA1 family, multidrug resistance protein